MILTGSQERSDSLPARPLSPVAGSDINNHTRTGGIKITISPHSLLSQEIVAVDIGNEVRVTVTMSRYRLIVRLYFFLKLKIDNNIQLQPKQLYHYQF